jgi:flagellar biogenesis protein FliO
MLFSVNLIVNSVIRSSSSESTFTVTFLNVDYAKLMVAVTMVVVVAMVVMVMLVVMRFLRSLW